LVWGLGVLAYAVAVFNRSSLGVAGVLALHRFGASAAVLSVFSVLQLAVYAGLQIPVGLLLDRFGSRRLLVIGAVLMALGQVVLAVSYSLPLAVLARVLVGAGDAMTFTSVLRLVTVWFPPRRVPVVTQLTGLVGQLGQIAAAYPLVALLRAVGWESSFAAAGGVGVVVAVLVATTLRDAPPGGGTAPEPLRWQTVRSQLRSSWAEPGTRLGLWTHFVTQFPSTVFALLWGYPFLVVGERRSPTEAGLLLTLLVLVSLVVGPTLGHVVGRWPYRRSLPTLTIVASSAAAWTLVLTWPGRAPLLLLVLLVVVLATNGPGAMVGFDYARTENPVARISSATGIVNVGGFIASLVTILAIGVVLTALAGPHGAGNTLADFRWAMSVQYVIWAVGLVGVRRSRRRLRRARELTLDAAPLALLRLVRGRSRRRAGSLRP
jgi:nitrate/nitrite transporter NarK